MLRPIDLLSSGVKSPEFSELYGAAADKSRDRFRRALTERIYEMASSTAEASAEAGEVEGGDDVLAAGGFDFDGGFGRGDVTGVELQPDDSSAEAAFAAVIENLGALPEGLDPPAVLGQVEAKIFPEILRLEADSLFLGDSTTGGHGFRVAISRGEFDANENEKGVAAVAIILLRLLSAIVAGLLARDIDDLCVRCEQLDFRDVRAYFREGETLGVGIEHRSHFFVITLAKEISFAD